MTEPTFRMTKKYTQEQIVDIASMIEKTDKRGNIIALKSKIAPHILKKFLIEAGIPEENCSIQNNNIVEVFELNGGHVTEIWDFFFLIDNRMKLQSLKDARLKLDEEIAASEKAFAEKIQKDVRQK